MIGPVETFQIEAKEHLVNLEAALLELETSTDDSELIDTAFRAIHTIKGAAGMFGFQSLTNFAHHLETALDKVRSGTLLVTPQLIGVFLDAGDLMEDMLDDTDFSADQIIASDALLQRLYAIVPERASETVTVEESMPKVSAEESVFRIRLTPDKETFRNGFDVLPILRELSGFGSLSVTVIDDRLPESVSDFEPEKCYLSWDLLLVSTETENTVEDTFMFVADDWEIKIDAIDITDEDEVSDRLGELLISRGVMEHNTLADALGAQVPLGKMVREKAQISEVEIQAALREQEVVRKIKQKKKGPGGDATVRVPAEKLDALMNMVGELVIVQARLNQVASEVKRDDIDAISEELELLTTQMRDETFGIRMMPIGSTFGRFRRLVRDLSGELGKSIQLETLGADTELDKVVLDKLGDPLVHLIRNSIDHGIETKSEREAVGKSVTGSIVLSASHADSMVIIKITDDGRGLNRDKIRQKALEKQLISERDELTEQQINQLIFEPGFSTAAKVSDISGRGVGMDVVKRSIMELGGTLAIDSVPGEGTDLTIKLPMTMAIIEGLMVEVGKERYVLPLNHVEECIELPTKDVSDTARKRLVEVRGKQIPFINLREWFECTSEAPDIQQVVITHSGEERFGFSVDEVIGQYQTVIKRLGKLYEGVTGFSGATILGDGNVAMILDTTALIESASLAAELDDKQTREKRILL